MPEKRERASDKQNEKYCHPDPATLRTAMWGYINSLPPEFHQKYHIPSLEVHEGKFQVSRH
jgi:hypothetical protein